MKKFFKKIKWNRIAWVCAGMAVMYFTIAAVNYRASQKLKEVQIAIDNSTGLLFINDADIMMMLNDLKIKSGLNTLDQIDCHKIERALEQNPFINNAETYIDALGNLHLTLQQRVPILRIINRSGVSFYIDETGTKMPLNSKFTARVTIASGAINVNESNADTTGNVQLKNLFTIADYVKKDTFLTRLAEQIWMDDSNEFHLIPKIAGQDILFGDLSDMDLKFKKLKAFYQSTIHTNCVDYKVINLKFRNEIYASRKDYVPPVQQPKPVAVSIQDTINKIPTQ